MKQASGRSSACCASWRRATTCSTSPTGSTSIEGLRRLRHQRQRTTPSSFTNGVDLAAGEATGDVTEATQRRIQIREAIKAHFDKEQALFAQGIKVLSLFFIDEVAKYRDYDGSRTTNGRLRPHLRGGVRAVSSNEVLDAGGNALRPST